MPRFISKKRMQMIIATHVTCAHPDSACNSVLITSDYRLGCRERVVSLLHRHPPCMQHSFGGKQEVTKRQSPAPFPDIPIGMLLALGET